MRFAVGVEYNGQDFHGWQTQKSGVRTVQQMVEAALSQVANHAVRIFCAGRTDAGVHALGQVIHFETTAERNRRSWLLGANANLPKDVSLLWIKSVDEDFHARFSAQARAYRYVIYNRHSRSAIYYHKVTWIYNLLDHQRMQEGAQYLVGTFDFSSYRALACQAKSPIKTIEYIKIKRQNDFIILDIKANAFLHHMVRNIVGVLITIGEKKQPIDWTKTILEYKDRRKGGVTAKPDGLYFQKVDYPEKYQLPEPSILSLI